LVPILADNLNIGRWAHRRALAISENAQSRFIGVTSSTLAMRLQTDPAIIGFALGPARPADDGSEPAAMERAAMFITADPAHSPAAGSTRWHADDWVQSIVGTYAGVPDDDP
jgi:hypothetical protein